MIFVQLHHTCITRENFYVTLNLETTVFAIDLQVLKSQYFSMYYSVGVTENCVILSKMELIGFHGFVMGIATSKKSMMPTNLKYQNLGVNSSRNSLSQQTSHTYF